MVQEWVCWDESREDICFIRASSHKEAIDKAIRKWDYVPHTVNDCRPRTGDANIMSKEKFREYVNTEYDNLLEKL